MRYPVMKIILNGQDQEIADQTTVMTLLQKVNIHPERVAVEVNLEIIDREDFGATSLKGGDQVEVISFVGGG